MGFDELLYMLLEIEHFAEVPLMNRLPFCRRKPYWMSCHNGNVKKYRANDAASPEVGSVVLRPGSCHSGKCRMLTFQDCVNSQNSRKVRLKLPSGPCLCLCGPLRCCSSTGWQAAGVQGLNPAPKNLITDCWCVTCRTSGSS